MNFKDLDQGDAFSFKEKKYIKTKKRISQGMPINAYTKETNKHDTTVKINCFFVESTKIEKLNLNT